MAQNPFHSIPFRQYGNAAVVAASTSSATAALARSADQSVVVTNPHATSVAFVKFGAGAQTATNADFAVPPQRQAILSIPAEATHVGVLLDAATSNIYVSVGDGSVI